MTTSTVCIQMYARLAAFSTVACGEQSKAKAKAKRRPASQPSAIAEGKESAVFKTLSHVSTGVSTRVRVSTQRKSDLSAPRGTLEQVLGEREYSEEGGGEVGRGGAMAGDGGPRRGGPSTRT